ncbi:MULTISPECIES: hypothetical protein [unclassified Shewanella]|uniref:hypothetical protein n=1 Tax=unclassified Shewanella TaxID=196818 RepID=UPI000C83E970|nr:MULTISPECIES: hypothetical protein [unclassified Shewanella]MDO6678513.1 hypothetical protein [Shewanella sp. 4_MG-2023]
MNPILSELEQLNSAAFSAITQIEQAKPEDEQVDELVSQLQVLIQRREIVIQALVNDDSVTDRAVLESQFDYTQSLFIKATRVLEHRKLLLQAGNAAKRQINVYKSIDANR